MTARTTAAGSAEKEVSNVDNLWKRLLAHCGHRVEIAVYGNPESPDNVSLECTDCNEIILDAEIYTICERKDSSTDQMHNYERCNGCAYYYGEIDSCMYGEPDVPTDAPRKCKEGKNEQV